LTLANPGIRPCPGRIRSIGGGLRQEQVGKSRWHGIWIVVIRIVIRVIVGSGGWNIVRAAIDLRPCAILENKYLMILISAIDPNTNP